LQFGRLQELAKQLHLELTPLVPYSSSSSSSSSPQATAPSKPSSDATMLGNSANLRTEYQPLALTHLAISVPEKLQMMEQEIRQLRTNFYAVDDDLQATSKELGIISDRLGWARDEIAEYRARVIDLEKSMHKIVQSKTWKLGRVFTKPVEVLTKKSKP
jgi:hypothetical protein